MRLALLFAAAIGAAAAEPARDSVRKPNIILCMTDDQGWGDVSYNGCRRIRTPNLDAMAAAGLRFDRFYAAHPSCSPTRASVLTGRHPFRTGTFWPGMPLRLQETTIAQAVKRVGYATGHFGKWHLSGGKPGAGRALAADDPLHPGRFGFDEWFTVSNWFDTDWTFSRKGEPVKVPGDGSEAIVAEALTFIERNSQQNIPFLAVVWFGSPHLPLKPTAEDLRAAGGSAYYGEILGVDRSMGVLREGLRTLGLADNTMLWFNSDNGAWVDEKAPPDTYGSNGALRGHKGQLWEGGIRVPGLMEWPARIKRPFVTDVPVCTSDIYPTLVEVLDLTIPGQPLPLDGISLVPLLDGRMKERARPIGFWHPDGTGIFGDLSVWIGNRYKLHKLPGGRYALYDLPADPSEKTDLAAQHPDIVNRMQAEMEIWRESVRRSNAGDDYPGGLPAKKM